MFQACCAGLSCNYSLPWISILALFLQIFSLTQQILPKAENCSNREVCVHLLSCSLNRIPSSHGFTLLQLSPDQIILNVWMIVSSSPIAMISVPRTPTARWPLLTASKAYSTWNLHCDTNIFSMSKFHNLKSWKSGKWPKQIWQPDKKYKMMNSKHWIWLKVVSSSWLSWYRLLACDT